MKNIAFVIWIIGWPLCMDISNAISKYTDRELKPWSDNAAFLVILIWIIVAGLVYQK